MKILPNFILKNYIDPALNLWYNIYVGASFIALFAWKNPPLIFTEKGGFLFGFYIINEIIPPDVNHEMISQIAEIPTKI